MTVTRCPSASQWEIRPYRTVPVPPACGWVQSRSASTRMWRGAAVGTAAKVPQPNRRTSLHDPLASAGMPHRTRIAAFLASAALLLAPGAALAQSGGAGDQQYQDPFSGQQSGSGSSSGSSSGGSGLSQSAPSSTGTAAPTVAQGTGAATAQGGQLARTGIDLRLLAGLGMLLLVAGIALRRSGHERR